MRPDKKKKQHHDSRKRAEKAREGQAAHAEASEKAETNQNTAEECDQPTPSNTTSESEPPKSCKDRVKKIEEKPAKNISSNWTKYEIPSEDEIEEDSATTGINFNFALENAGQIPISINNNVSLYHLQNWPIHWES